MAKTRRKYKGNAPATTITGGISDTASSITLASATGYPTSGPFYAVIDPGLSTEEKILVGSISGTALSSVTRGVDDTTAQAHAAGATIYPVFTAVDADEANELTSTYAHQGAMVYQGASTFSELQVGTAGQVLKVNSGATAPEWGQVATAGLADSSVTSAKIVDGTIVDADVSATAAIALSKLATGALPSGITVASANIVDLEVNTADIADGAVTSAKITDGTIVNSDINASAAIALSKLATGALPTAITVASANIVDGTIVAADIASDAVETAKIKDAAVTTAKFASGIEPVIVVTASGSLPTGVDGMVAYVNDNTSSEGLYTYNGTAWRKGPGWNAPWGVVSFQTSTTTDSSIGTTEKAMFTTSSFTAVANRYYRIKYTEPQISNSASYSTYVKIRLTSTTGTELQGQLSSIFGNVPLEIITTLTAGSTVLVATLKADGGTTTATRGSTAGYGLATAQFIVEDIGPSGAPA